MTPFACFGIVARKCPIGCRYCGKSHDAYYIRFIALFVHPAVPRKVDDTSAMKVKIPKKLLRMLAASVGVLITGALAGAGYHYVAVWQPEEVIASLNTAPWRALNVDAYSFEGATDF